MKSSKLLICIVFCLAVGSAHASDGDFSTIYTQETLTYWRPIFELRVRDLIRIHIQPKLAMLGREALPKVDLPLRGSGGSPFDFHYDRSSDTLEIPVLSAKFLYDMVAASEWLRTHGFGDCTVFYLSALKYQGASQFPNGHYVTPFEALDIPHDAHMAIAFETLSYRFTFEELFNSALLFIVAHEIGHALYSPDNPVKLLTSQEQEVLADIFAGRVVAGSEFTLIGIERAFLYLTIFDRTADEFATQDKYVKWLDSAPHPMTAARVAGFGTQFAEHPHNFFPSDVSDSDPRIARAKTAGSELIALGKKLLELATKKGWRKLGQSVDIPSLATHKQCPQTNVVVPRPPDPELPPLPSDTRVGPPRALEEISEDSDLVKLSGGWWGKSFDEFPMLSGLTAPDYSTGSDPTNPGKKVLLPRADISIRKWAPRELVPFVFTFQESTAQGLIEIAGFLGGQSQEKFLKILTDRYGSPTRILRALGFTTYVWDFDRSVLEVNYIGFKIYPANSKKSN